MLKSVRRTCVRSSVPSHSALVTTASVLAASALMLLGSVGSAWAVTVLDTSPYDLEMSQGGLSGPDVAGGTFTAAEDYLNRFTLYLGSVGGNPNNELRAVVMAVDGDGLPTGSPLWQSDPLNAPGALVEYVFDPNMSVLTGSQYFIGIDAGVVTGAAGGDFTIGMTSGDPMAGGHFMWSSNGAPFWTESTFSDIASQITMSSSIVYNPEPSTVLLVGMGLAFFGARRRLTSV